MGNTDDKERAEFERFALSKWPLMDLRRREDGEYADFDARTTWLAWQASAGAARRRFLSCPRLSHSLRARRLPSGTACKSRPNLMRWSKM